MPKSNTAVLLWKFLLPFEFNLCEISGEPWLWYKINLTCIPWTLLNHRNSLLVFCVHNRTTQSSLSSNRPTACYVIHIVSNSRKSEPLFYLSYGLSRVPHGIRNICCTSRRIECRRLTSAINHCAVSAWLPHLVLHTYVRVELEACESVACSSYVCRTGSLWISCMFFIRM
jgi:hypothetical protein